MGIRQNRNGRIDILYDMDLVEYNKIPTSEWGMYRLTDHSKTELQKYLEFRKKKVLLLKQKI